MFDFYLIVGFFVCKWFVVFYFFENGLRLILCYKIWFWKELFVLNLVCWIRVLVCYEFFEV